MSQFVVEVFAAVLLLAVIGVSLQRKMEMQ